ncbi:MAG: phosphoenolpyruvate carboxykinase (ATP), partial [Myxococcota bacterium]
MLADENVKAHLEKIGITVQRVLRNPPPSLMYEEALQNERGTQISSTGALVALSGAKTGRSPNDKRVVKHPDTEDDIWWGEVNIELDEKTFDINRARAVDYLNTRQRLFIIDGFA